MRTAIVILAVVVASCAADFLTDSVSDCASAELWSKCLKRRFLGYLDGQLGADTRSADLDEAVVARTGKYLKGFDYSLDLPLVGGKVLYRPSRGLDDVELDLGAEGGRGLLKKKLLLPVLLLLKLKFKALMPIFMAIIGLKAMKALIMSKLALLIVVAFVALQFFKKGGMMPPPGSCFFLGRNPVFSVCNAGKCVRFFR